MRIELPRSEFKIDPSENFLDSVTQSITGSIAESNNTNVKALVAVHDDDQRFVYKKLENSVILQFRLGLFEGYECDKHEIVFGFQMVTNSSRYNKEPFKLVNPIMFNCGKTKSADPNAHSVSSSVSSMPGISSAQSVAQS